jgi:hypothetical protein
VVLYMLHISMSKRHVCQIMASEVTSIHPNTFLPNPLWLLTRKRSHHERITYELVSLLW